MKSQSKSLQHHQSPQLRQLQRRSQRRDGSFHPRFGFESRNRAGRRNRRARSRRPNVLRSRSRAWCSHQQRLRPSAPNPRHPRLDVLRHRHGRVVARRPRLVQRTHPHARRRRECLADRARCHHSPCARSRRHHRLLVRVDRRHQDKHDRHLDSGRPGDSTVLLFSDPRGVDANDRRRPRCLRRLLLHRQSRESSLSLKA